MATVVRERARLYKVGNLVETRGKGSLSRDEKGEENRLDDTGDIVID